MISQQLLFVNGTLMRGLKLHDNLKGATFVSVARTASNYRMHSIGDRHPGMYRVDVGGYSITGELYRVPPSVRAFVEANEPPDLYVGEIELNDGRRVAGVLYPRELAEGRHPDISTFGDWRRYMAMKSGVGVEEQPSH